MGVAFQVVLAVLVAYAIYRVGLMIIASFGTPVAEPPPPGELRKVRLDYRCDVCGSEIRMTRAPLEDPEPPRCCMEPMELLHRAE